MSGDGLENGSSAAWARKALRGGRLDRFSGGFATFPDQKVPQNTRGLVFSHLQTVYSVQLDHVFVALRS